MKLHWLCTLQLKLGNIGNWGFCFFVCFEKSCDHNFSHLCINEAILKRLFRLHFSVLLLVAKCSHQSNNLQDRQKWSASVRILVVGLTELMDRVQLSKVSGEIFRSFWFIRRQLSSCVPERKQRALENLNPVGQKSWARELSFQAFQNFPCCY